MTPEYEAKLKQGLEYQDFVADKLYEAGIPVTSYSSQKYQNMIGENKAGLEIKFDNRWKETGNIYIEVAEKSKAENINFIASGIFRNDNTWLYVIGDYTKIFILPKKYLKMLYNKNVKNYKLVETPTSKGMLIPVRDIENIYSIRTIEIQEDKFNNN